MRLGIDFGTTRTVVACADRGNYPVVSFVADGGDSIDWFPSLVAARGAEMRFGLDALAVAEDKSWTLVRSFKRVLGDEDVTPQTEIDVAGRAHRVVDVGT